ncbi:MAG: hypothetical protein AABX65_01400 [Nanoarchaeota archaeon]
MEYIEEKKMAHESGNNNYRKIAFYAVLAVLIIIFLQWKYQVFFSPDKECLSIDGSKLMLESHGKIKMHIHPELKIKINGKNIEIPASIGITNTGMNAIHMHTLDGVIHVEAPCVRDFTLGDFFEVWGKSFDSEHILEHTVNETSKLKMLVNGRENNEFERLVLKDKDEIEIIYE